MNATSASGGLQPLTSGKKALWLLVAIALIFLLIGALLMNHDAENKSRSAAQNTAPAQVASVFPVCADAKDIPIPEDKSVWELPQMPVGCFTGFVQTPPRWPKWWLDSSPRKDFLLWFRDAPAPTYIVGGRSTDPATGREYSFPGQYSFRVMGTEEKMSLIVKRAEKEIKMAIKTETDR